MSLSGIFHFKRYLNFHILKSFFCYTSGAFFIAFILSSDLQAQGNLLITPRRVVFEDSKRSVDLNLANTGKDTATYSISLLQIRMKEDGTFETITEPDPGQRFADPYLRFFPRSVTLGPNEAQVVKVQLIKTNELTDGEYRSHFYFRAVPREKPLGEEEKIKDTSSISVSLTPVFGITIPVIVRAGVSSTKVSLSDLTFQTINDTVPGLSMTFNRTGNMSVYGDITVDYVSTAGKMTRVGTANGVAVYTPNKVRRFHLALNKLPGVDFSKGTLRISYSASTDVKPERYTIAELTLH